MLYSAVDLERPGPEARDELAAKLDRFVEQIESRGSGTSRRGDQRDLFTDVPPPGK